MFSADLGVTPSAANYIEDVFSTYLYTGTAATQTITNGIDLSTNSGMVWLKSRSAVGDHYLFDTSRGTTKFLASNSTNQQLTGTTTLTAFNSNGFTLGSATATNGSGATYASWTFRKQAKFFDVVTYTGNGTAGREIAHSLGSAPGCIIVKQTSGTESWTVYHTSLFASNTFVRLNSTSAGISGLWNRFGNDSVSIAPTSTVFTVGSDPATNGSGSTYVAYLFAHDAGGFGATGSDNVISCGSFNTGGTGAATVTLGYEPQWVMIKQTNGASNWVILDTMRGWATGNNDDMRLNPNLSVAESSDELGFPTATGFQASGFGFNQTWIYIAIRRGPMRTPTTGTSVFEIDTASSYAANEIIPTSFPPDISINKARIEANNWWLPSRITGGYLSPNQTAAEVSGVWKWDGIAGQSYATSVYTGTPIYYSFRRAPGFFDVVCYTGTGANRTVSHNLGVAPELMIVKRRGATGDWFVYNQTIGNTKYLQIQAIDAAGTDATNWNSTSPTSSVFSLGSGLTNASSSTYVAYLFATVAGVSKVGSYTGTGTTNQINCGFTAGARFVLIKRTDNTGSWYVWDTARGIVSGNDPYLLLNDSAAEVTGTDYVDTYSAGFEISSTAPAAINANGGSFIFLAIA